MRKPCRTQSKQKIFVFEEQRSKLILNNKQQILSTKIILDGCEIDDKTTKRCDYLLFTESLSIYIELKGQDINQAIEQLIQSIKIYKTELGARVKKCYIICSRSPMASTKIQNHMKMFRKDYNAELIIKSSPYEDAY